MYIDKLDDIVDEYSNTYHRAIKMKPVEVKDNTLLEDPRFQVGDHVRISKYKNIFAKRISKTLNWSEEIFAISTMSICH